MASDHLSTKPDLSCPYCRGQRAHAKSQRAGCKSKGSIKKEPVDGNDSKKRQRR